MLHVYRQLSCGEHTPNHKYQIPQHNNIMLLASYQPEFDRIWDYAKWQDNPSTDAHNYNKAMEWLFPISDYLLRNCTAPYHT